MPAFVLASTIVTMLALEVPFPVELTALAMVGLVLRWALARDDKAHAGHDSRIMTLEAEMRVVRESESEQRHLKHALLNQIGAARGALVLVSSAARTCKCDAMAPLIPLLDALDINHLGDVQ